MPEKETLEAAEEDKREGKSASTQAGEFVREEMHHIREGKHGARSAKQAIAIGLSKARRAGVDLPPPKKGTTSEETRTNARRAVAPKKADFEEARGSHTQGTEAGGTQGRLEDRLGAPGALGGKAPRGRFAQRRGQEGRQDEEVAEPGGKPSEELAQSLNQTSTRRRNGAHRDAVG
jgi:hypothetical protein